MMKGRGWQRIGLVAVFVLLVGACGQMEPSADQHTMVAEELAATDIAVVPPAVPVEPSLSQVTYPEPASLALPQAQGSYPEPLALPLATPEPPLIYPQWPEEGMPYWEPTPPPPPEQTQTAVVVATDSALTDQTQDAFATIRAYTPTPEPIIGPWSYGPALREVWPVAPPGTAPITELLLVKGTDWHDFDVSLWRVQLPSGQPHKLADLDHWFFGAALSSDQRRLAYLAGSDDGPLMRVKDLASQQETYFVGFSVGRHSSCSTTLAWSPDSQLLAFATYDDEREQFQVRVYAGGAPAQSKVVLESPAWVDLFGWFDAERVLVVLAEPEYKHLPARLVVVNVRSGVQQELASVPGGSLDCPRLSPDRRRLLFTGPGGQPADERMLLDTATGQLSRSGVQPEEHLVWGADNATVLLRSTGDGRTMKLRRLDQPDAANTFLTFGPPMRSSAHMRLLDASPDGRWLLACTSPGATWLYDIVADRWTELGDGCAQALGWWPQRQEQR